MEVERWQSFWRKTRRKEWKASLPLHDRRAAEYRWGRPSFYIFGTGLGASCHSHDFNEPSPESIWREVSTQKKKSPETLLTRLSNLSLQVNDASAFISSSTFFARCLRQKLKIWHQPVPFLKAVNLRTHTSVRAVSLVLANTWRSGVSLMFVSGSIPSDDNFLMRRRWTCMWHDCYVVSRCLVTVVTQWMLHHICKWASAISRE